MKKYMAVFTGNPDAFKAWQAKFPDPKEQAAQEQKGMQAWMAWGEAHKAAIVVDGSPLGKTKRVTQGGIADHRNNLAGFTIVQAESQEAAARMFLGHPHFSIFPGDGVEIMECLPIPGM